MGWGGLGLAPHASSDLTKTGKKFRKEIEEKVSLVLLSPRDGPSALCGHRDSLATMSPSPNAEPNAQPFLEARRAGSRGTVKVRARLQSAMVMSPAPPRGRP